MSRKSVCVYFVLALAVNLFGQSARADYEAIWGHLEDIAYEGTHLFYKANVLEVLPQPKAESSGQYEYVELATFEKNNTEYFVSWVKGIAPETRYETGIGVINRATKSTLFLAKTVCIPSLDSIYLKYGKYQTSDKYQYDGKEFEKVVQPFYYWGVTVATRGAVDIFSDQKLTSKTASVSAGTSVLVIGVLYYGDSSLPLLIIRSGTGIVGYARAKIFHETTKDGDQVLYDIPLFDHVYSSAG